MGLRIKLLLVWIALLLTPLAILSGIGYFYIDNQLQKDSQQYRLDLTRSLAESVVDYLQRLKNLAAHTASHPSLVVALNSTVASGADEGALQRARAELQRAADYYPGSQQFYLIRRSDVAQPLVVVSADGLGEQSIPHLSTDELRRIFGAAGTEGAATNNESIHLSSFDRDGAEADVLVAVAPVPGENGQGVSGFVVMLTDQQMLLDLVALGAGNTRAAHYFVVNEKGRVLGKPADIPFGQISQPKSMLPMGAASSNSIENYAVGDKDFQLSFERLGNGLWLGSALDTGLLLEKKLPYIIVFAMTLSATLLFSGLVFNMFVNNIAIKPIHKLIVATRQIAKGDFKPALKVRSNDELGELAVAFRQMGKQLLHTSKRIRQLAYYDPLTQLPNRTTLRETLNRLLSQSQRLGTKTAVLFIDLDDFKKVNDRLGHEAGDELLVQISDRLKERLRQSDVLFEQTGFTSVEQLISRRGGDEFNAILSSIKAPHDAALVAERIIQDLNEPFFVANSEIHVGASVGIAIFPNDGHDADTLLRNADLAMYEAKAKGKNNYHIFTSAINEQVHQRLALEHALQMAMVHSQFRLYYQPKISLTDMRPVGFEALIRWQHPSKGMILPSKFIPVAEESNLIRDIGNWILGESMQQVQLWEKFLPDGVRIAINISARQLAQSDLVDQLRTMMDHFGLSPRRLEIELTETSVLQDEHMASQHLNDLRALGVEISLDDFGTGYSSLSFLRNLPIDTVKIDRSFTANVTHNSEARAIVVSLLGLCRELKVKTIAEGIETTEQLQFLMEYGCDQGQGFLFSAPLPSNEVMGFLADPSYIAIS